MKKGSSAFIFAVFFFTGLFFLNTNSFACLTTKWKCKDAGCTAKSGGFKQPYICYKNGTYQLIVSNMCPNRKPYCNEQKLRIDGA